MRKRQTYCLTGRKEEVASFTIDFSKDNVIPVVTVMHLFAKLLIIFIAISLWKIEPTAFYKCLCLHLEIKEIISKLTHSLYEF